MKDAIVFTLKSIFIIAFHALFLGFSVSVLMLRDEDFRSAGFPMNRRILGVAIIAVLTLLNSAWIFFIFKIVF